MKTSIITGDEPLDIILNGTKKLHDAVSVTMGPRGRNVVFKKLDKRVGITHDGVTVAKMTHNDDEAEEAAAELLREAAIKLDATTGDGTTTVTVLTYAILIEAVKKIKEGESPMKLKLALEALQPEIIKQIEKATDKNVTLEKLQSVASVSSGSKEIGKEVGETIFNAGKDTPVILGISSDSKTTSEILEGFKIKSGPASPYLMNDLKEELPSPKIAVVDAKLRNKEDIMPFLKLLAKIPQEERNVLLVCEDIAGDALNYAVLNKIQGFVNLAVARVPANVPKTEYLKDLAISCGAQVMSRNTGYSILDPKLECFGSAKAVTVEPNETVIIEGKSNPEDLEVHKAQLKEIAKRNPQLKKLTEERLKSLEQKIVSIFVGGQSDTEAEEKHYRYEDAIGACRAALRSGVVPGGGTLLFSIGGNLSLEGDSPANKILATALMQPLVKVTENAGIDSIPTITIGKGFDVLHPEDGVVDLVKRGILDPVESEIQCVKTAITIAGLLITTGAMVIDRKENETQQEPNLS